MKEEVGGNWLWGWMAVGGMLGALGEMNSVLCSQARLLQYLSVVVEFFPRWFSPIHSRFKTPYVLYYILNLFLFVVLCFLIIMFAGFCDYIGSCLFLCLFNVLANYYGSGCNPCFYVSTYHLCLFSFSSLQRTVSNIYILYSFSFIIWVDFCIAMLLGHSKFHLDL